MGNTAESRTGFVLEFGFSLPAPNTGIISRQQFPNVSVNTVGKAGRPAPSLLRVWSLQLHSPSFCGSLLTAQGKNLYLYSAEIIS